MKRLDPISVIEFNEQPANTLLDASTQLEHLYIHAGKHAEAINALIEKVNALIDAQNAHKVRS